MYKDFGTMSAVFCDKINFEIMKADTSIRITDWLDGLEYKFFSVSVKRQIKLKLK